jgi:hypothetical protein
LLLLQAPAPDAHLGKLPLKLVDPPLRLLCQRLSPVVLIHETSSCPAPA